MLTLRPFRTRVPLTIAEARSDAWSFVKTLDTWLRTVFRLIPSSWAIAAFPFPLAMSESTSRSRWVRDGNVARGCSPPWAKWR